MAAQPGKSYLLKVGDGGGTEAFTAIAGMRSVRFSRGRRAIDVTNADSANEARELITAAGVKEATASFTGVFLDGATDATLETDFEAGTLRNFEIVIPDYGTYLIPAIITKYDHEAAYDGEGKFSIELTSGGDWTFT